MKRTIVLLMLAFAALVGVAGPASAHAPQTTADLGGRPVGHPHYGADPMLEDQPGFDCRYQGNLSCGATPRADRRARARLAVCDRQYAWRHALEHRRGWDLRAEQRWDSCVAWVYSRTHAESPAPAPASACTWAQSGDLVQVRTASPALYGQPVTATTDVETVQSRMTTGGGDFADLGEFSVLGTTHTVTVAGVVCTQS